MTYEEWKKSKTSSPYLQDAWNAAIREAMRIILSTSKAEATINDTIVLQLVELEALLEE